MKILLCTAAAIAAFTVRPAVHELPFKPAWKVDPVHSSVVFKVKHAGASWFYGSFNAVSGGFTLDAKSPADSSIEVVVDAGSIDTRDEKRDQHLKGPDFFDAKQFPEIKFVSKKVTAKGDNFSVAGELTLRGETKPLSIEVVKTGEGEFYGKRVGYETSFTIKRSEFGMDYGIADKVLGDEVTLTIAIEGVENGGDKK